MHIALKIANSKYMFVIHNDISKIIKLLSKLNTKIEKPITRQTFKMCNALTFLRTSWIFHTFSREPEFGLGARYHIFVFQVVDILPQLFKLSQKSTKIVEMRINEMK